MNSESRPPDEVDALVVWREHPPDDRELDFLLRLLDDETPQVRYAVARRLALVDGDLSEWLAEREMELDEARSQLLSEMLVPGRRRRLMDEWQAPLGGASALSEDWDHFEAMLRVISDFLHDGVTLRQPLSDGLDLLADEAEEAGVESPEELRVWLFEEARYVGNEFGVADPCNLDLAWVVDSGRADAIGLSMLFLLVARRLELEVEAVDYPGHFFCRIHRGGRPVLVDCFDYGRVHPQEMLLRRMDIGRLEKRHLQSTADPGVVLARVLSELALRLRRVGRTVDAEIMDRLHRML